MTLAHPMDVASCKVVFGGQIFEAERVPSTPTKTVPPRFRRQAHGTDAGDLLDDRADDATAPVVLDD